MFARRHPYLFFILAFVSLVSATIIGLSLLFFIGTRHTDFEFGEKVGVIEVIGAIADSKDIIHKLKLFREEDSIKAIVIRIDSPGGGVGPSQEIFREIRKTSEIKKVIASMGGVAASGGYYIAVGADGIVANPGTITGSIGVLMGYTNFQELLNKIGLVPIVIKSGEYKDIGSPVRKMTEKEEKILSNLANQIHVQFIKAIAEGRGMEESKIEKLADGRIFSGEEAKKLGLIDRLGNLEDAVEWAGRMGGIKGKISTVYPQEKKFSILEYLVNSFLKEFTNRFVNPSLFAGYLYRPAG
jgi:protease-4